MTNYPMAQPVILIDGLDNDLNDIKQPVKFYFLDGYLRCADIDALDYYGEFRGGFPWIHPALKEWAKQNSGFWEWENPEAISFCLN